MNDYKGKSRAELEFIIRDAGEAAEAMKGHNPQAEGKYLDQVNDARTELNRRASKRGGPKPGAIAIVQSFTGRWGYCPADSFLLLRPDLDEHAVFASSQACEHAVKRDRAIPEGSPIAIIHNPAACADVQQVHQQRASLLETARLSADAKVRAYCYSEILACDQAIKAKS